VKFVIVKCLIDSCISWNFMWFTFFAGKYYQGDCRTL
jgi:hypothetical protein